MIREMYLKLMCHPMRSRRLRWEFFNRKAYTRFMAEELD